MPADTSSVARACAEAALRAGREIRELVHGMPVEARGQATTSLLKPTGGYGARLVDARAEELGMAHLERLAAEIGVGIALLVEPGSLSVRRLGHAADGPLIWATMDVIDGTVKVAGLGPSRPGRVALANDGAWAAAFAFTLPTAKPADALVLGDFVVAVVVDGNPPRWRTYPQDLVTLPCEDGPLTLEVLDGGERRVFTTTNEELGQLWVSLDVFQAHDVATRRAGDVETGIELYRLLTDRHGDGAFDVLRQYANLSALARLLFGWREPPVWIESQGAGFIVVNENLPNLIPAVPLVAGAGGVSVDFEGRPLLGRRLGAGRTSVLHAANPTLRRRLLDVVAAARARAGTAAR
jgi:hypothetical protein